ncbi:hypothetical protein QUS89_23010, partial [Xanthomonas citri pv. citri]
MSRKFGMTVVGAAMALALSACGGSGAGGGSAEPAAGASGGAEEGGTIGVAMPTRTSERWIADGNAVKEQLEEKGYDVALQYANDDIPTQSQQVD